MNQYRLAQLMPTSNPTSLVRNPRFPRWFVNADDQLVPVSHQWHPENQRLFGKSREPPVIGKLRVTKTELGEAFGVLVYERRHAELLRKAP